ncbi:MAG: CDP-alcohol phosphatidyltransferase family protein [Chloroflexota bacterium]|nr:CDP-alcohol phosphatidyltransferase family protein [Chloroflexota bacterium]
MSLADALAALRALAIVPIWYALAIDARGVALVIFVLAAASDAADGWVARRAGVLSGHGALVDPLADKIFVVGTALALILVGMQSGQVLPPELFALLAVREITAAVLRVASYRAGTHHPADLGGKVKTAAQMCALGLLIILRPPEPLAIGAVALLWVAVLFGLVSLAQYWPRRRISVRS